MYHTHVYAHVFYKLFFTYFLLIFPQSPQSTTGWAFARIEKERTIRNKGINYQEKGYKSAKTIGNKGIRESSLSELYNLL